MSQQAAASPTADARTVLDAVAANPALQNAHVVIRQLVQVGIEGIPQPAVRDAANLALVQMLQGTGLTFGALKGSRLPCPVPVPTLSCSPLLAPALPFQGMS